MFVAIGFVLCAMSATMVRVFVAKHLDKTVFPFGTFAVNVLGSFALGLLGGASDTVVTVIGVGALGSLTTFSSINVEIVRRRCLSAFVYLALSIVCGVLAAWLGLQISS